jgi:hypothetical protein
MPLLRNLLRNTHYTPAERVRLWIAHGLDRFFPARYCWTALVGWALGSCDLEEARQAAPECARECPTCYCGKFGMRLPNGAGETLPSEKPEPAPGMPF